MGLQRVKAALLTVGLPVSHFKAHRQADRYLVWAEEGAARALWCDGRLTEQAIQGTVDYFTRTEYDPYVEKIQRALGDAGIAFRLSSIQYEQDTKYTHYEWIWEVDAWQE